MAFTNTSDCRAQNNGFQQAVNAQGNFNNNAPNSVPANNTVNSNTNTNTMMENAFGNANRPARNENYSLDNGEPLNANNADANNILNKSKLITALNENEELSHPKSPSRWRTKEMIILGPLPEQSRLDNCMKETLAIGHVSPNAKALLSSVSVVADQVRKAPAIYHWCFYYWAVAIDEKLEADIIAKNYEDKLTFFVTNMKAMWILARALDRELESKKYFGYLRRRYMEISHDYFGRSRQVISLPLGDDPRLAPDLDMKEAIEEFEDF